MRRRASATSTLAFSADPDVEIQELMHDSPRAPKPATWPVRELDMDLDEDDAPPGSRHSRATTVNRSASLGADLD
jgi:hypothetical protein